MFVDEAFVVVAFVVEAFTTVRFVIVEDALLTMTPPVKYERRDVVAAPSDVPPETVREVRVPTEVSEELMTDDPRVVAERIDAPLILYERPDAMLMSPPT